MTLNDLEVTLGHEKIKTLNSLIEYFTTMQPIDRREKGARSTICNVINCGPISPNGFDPNHSGFIGHSKSGIV